MNFASLRVENFDAPATEIDETLGHARSPMPTASSVAMAQGWLARPGEVDGFAIRSLAAVPHRGDSLAHYRHNHPALLREGAVVPALWARASGARTKLLGIGWVAQFEGLVVSPGSGIREPGDLRGRRIALPRRTGYPIDFERAQAWHGIVNCLTAAGIEESDVRFVDVVSEEAPRAHDRTPMSASEIVHNVWSTVRAQRATLLALMQGHVDAVYVAGGSGLETSTHFRTRIVVELTNHRAWTEWRGNHLRVLTVNEDLLQRRPDLVAGYVGVLHEAAQWAATHEDQSLRIIAAELGLAETWVERGYHPDTAGHLELEASDVALEALDEWVKFLFDRGFLDARVDLENWLDRTVLAAPSVTPRCDPGVVMMAR
jgi:ABC-type nitrate/sulfonate/bicarbonate transport system substrate-binding protein